MMQDARKRSRRGLLIGMLVLALGAAGGCGGGLAGAGRRADPPRVRVLTPQRIYSEFEWSPAEQQREIAVKPLRMTRNASYSVVRVRTAEKPHVHDRTDLVVTVLSGRVRMHLGLQSVELVPGEVIDIPRGMLHWAESIGQQPAEAFVVATPPYDGSDMRLLDVNAQP